MLRRWISWLICLIVLLCTGYALYRHAAPSSQPPPTRMTEAGLILLEEEEGLVVLAVEDGSPAARSGFHAGDVLLLHGRTALSTVPQLEALLQADAPQPLTLSRQQQLMTLDFRFR